VDGGEERRKWKRARRGETQLKELKAGQEAQYKDIKASQEKTCSI
jgi:uncharacterized membrane protein YqiK